VLHWFARLWEVERDDYWGYITNCGTEGNLHGILTGRENLPDGILYASSESHYSVFKAARMYRMDAERVCIFHPLSRPLRSCSTFPPPYSSDIPRRVPPPHAEGHSICFAWML